MNNVDAIKQLPYWEGTSARSLERFCSDAEVIRIDKGTVLTEQFKSATDFYLLCDGSIDHYLTLLSDTQLSIPVGRLELTWCAIGWSGFLEPHRYTTLAQSSVPSTLFRWHYSQIKTLAEDDPDFYRGLLSLITESSRILLAQTRCLLEQYPTQTTTVDNKARSTQPRLRLKLETESCINHLSYSNLFQGLKFHDLKRIAEHCWLERFTDGMEICAENESLTDVMILVRGTVNLYYTKKSSDSLNSCNSKVFGRSLSRPGQVISWAALTQSQRQDITALANGNVTICCIPVEAFRKYFHSKPDFAIKLHENLLHIIVSRLRSTRALLIGQYTRNEQATISTLLHNIGPQLSIESPLHKVPYLLKNRNTQEDAFRFLEHAQNRGGNFENNVASLCNDLLRETRKEAEFYRDLRSIYQMVVNSSDNELPGSIRNKSASEFARVFTQTRYKIKGEHHLPGSGGHIFILNHLISHPYHRLPNGFEFSLDTHFISSMILYPKYGDSGLRVVRKNRHDEYGHETYYQRLGHIYVHTGESQRSPGSRDDTRTNESFFQRATNFLQQGYNIIICPEGTSNWSINSPTPFKSGAFRLAAMQEKDTLIVPIAVAGFDKVLHETVFTAVIKPPFRIRNVVDPNNPDAMKIFMESFHAEYRGYVREALKLSNNN